MGSNNIAPWLWRVLEYDINLDLNRAGGAVIAQPLWSNIFDLMPEGEVFVPLDSAGIPYYYGDNPYE